MLTSYLDIQKCFLIFLNLAKLSPYQKMDQIDTVLLNIFIMILNSKNKLVWIMMYIMLYLFPFQALDELDLEVLDFWFFTELSTLKCFLLGFSYMQELLYICIFKVQLLSD